MIARNRRLRVTVVLKRSSFRLFVIERKDARVAELLEKRDPTVRRMHRSHQDHEATIKETLEAFAAIDARVRIVHGSSSKFPDGADLVVTIGGDGTLLHASHRVPHGVPILGINSSPGSSVGFFCAGKKGDVAETVDLVVRGKLPAVELSRMEVVKNDVVLDARVLNEALFCHASPAATSRYILRVTGPRGHVSEEEQKSSGLWIGPAAGSTAAQRSAGGKILPLASRAIQYVVREPYTPLGQRLSLVLGTATDGTDIVLRSKMHQAKLFLDGTHSEFDVARGDVLVMRRSKETLTVLGLTRKAARGS